MADEEMAFSLVMPFVVVESKGGPYRDQDYVAGFECGLLDAECADAAKRGRFPIVPLAVRSDNIPQIDLIAMRNGFLLAAEVIEETPEWSWVTFTRAGPDG